MNTSLSAFQDTEDTAPTPLDFTRTGVQERLPPLGASASRWASMAGTGCRTLNDQKSIEFIELRKRVRQPVPAMDGGKSSCQRGQCPEKRNQCYSMRLFMNNPG